MQALLKHAKNFVAKDDRRPYLEGIYFDGKSAYVSDGHVFVKVEHYPVTETGIFHYKTNKPIETVYPNMDKVIPQQFKTEFVLTSSQIRVWKKALKLALLIADKVYHMVEFNSANDQINMRITNEGTAYRTTLPVTGDRPDFETISLSCKYLSDIFAFFGDCGASIIRISINSRLSPILLKTDAGVLAVLAPINPANIR